MDLHWSNGTKKIADYWYDARGSQTYATNKEYIVQVPKTDDQGNIEYDENGNIIYTSGYSPELDTYYTYDKAGYMSKTRQEISLNVFRNTFHYYNGMEQPGCLDEQQIPKNLRPVLQCK